MKTALSNNQGFALVVALSFITALSLLAAIIVAVSTLEKRTSFTDYTHSRAFYSADAGGEAAINWLRIRGTPPGLLDAQKHVYVPTGYDTLSTDHLYRHDITYIRKRLRPGWSHEYKDFEYTIDSQGSSVLASESELEVRALRLFKEGY